MIKTCNIVPRNYHPNVAPILRTLNYRKGIETSEISCKIIDLYENLVFNRLMNTWNSLLSANITNTLKTRLDKF